MKNIAEAIKKDVESRGLTQQDVADRLGDSQAYVAQILNGYKRIGRKKAQQLHNAFGYNITFLLTGEGELIKKGDTDVSTPPASSSAQSQSLNNANIDQRINELLAISSNLHKMFESVNARLAEAAAIITKSQEQFDRVLRLAEQSMTGPHVRPYDMVAEQSPESLYNKNN